jgi:peptidoglycan/LPS O-acetylase OafA/YrhL
MRRTDGKSEAPAKGEKEGFRPDIEGLRGIAVMLVVIYHAGLLSNASVRLTGGFIGVDLFFVVSGFLITGLLIRERERTGRISFSKFYARRVRRILPAAAYVLLVTLPAAYILVTLIDRASVMVDGASAALSIANVRFALTSDYFNVNPAAFSPFLHFWSLGVEEQFYFIWPALMTIAAWRRPRLGAAVALGVITVGTFLASVAVTAVSPAWAFYMLPTRAWQLAAGGLLAIGAGSLDRAPRAIRANIGRALVVVGWVALAGLLYYAVILNTTVPYPGVAALLPTLAAVILVASGPAKYGPGVALRLTPIRFLGKISYSLYLWHWPLLILGGLYFGAPEGFSLTVPQAIGLAAFAIPVATVSWVLVEEPFRRGKIPLPRPSRVVAAGVAVMLIVAMVGASFSMYAQTALARISGSDVAAETETPTQIVTPTPASLPPNATPTPTPAFTPALTPMPSWKPATYAVTNALRPTLANAPTNREKVWADRCEMWEQSTVPCNKVYGDPNGTFSVALVGDSHGAALFPAVEQVAKAHHWKLQVYLKVACQFMDMRLHNDELKREYTECATFRANTIARLKADPPDLILVSNSRWVFPELASDDSITKQGQAMGREIAKLPAESRVAIIRDLPLPYNDVPECLSNHLSDWRRCAFSRASGFGTRKGARETIAASMTGASLVDLEQAVCPGTGACQVVINGMIVWRDGHHLTAIFSASIGYALDEELVPILLAPWPAPPATPTPSPSPALTPYSGGGPH